MFDFTHEYWEKMVIESQDREDAMHPFIFQATSTHDIMFYLRRFDNTPSLPDITPDHS